MKNDVITVNKHFSDSFHRHFFIHYNYEGCHADSGWIVVLDAVGHGCSWEGSAVGGKGAFIIYVTRGVGEFEGGVCNFFLLSEGGLRNFFTPKRGGVM